MSYTTGEIAKLCGVTVRTVQFYDKEGLLKPDGTSEGGRRLYGEGSVKTLQIICAYKSLGFSLAEIKRVISEKDEGAKSLLLLLEDKERELGAELEELTLRRDSLRLFKERLSSGLAVPPETLFDVRKIMEGKKRYKSAIIIMATYGVLGFGAEVTAIVLWAVMGLWIPFAVIYPCIIALAVVLVYVYYRSAAYVCRDCGKKFVPGFWQMLFAKHTPRTRKLTCPHCGAKKYHLETYRDE